MKNNKQAVISLSGGMDSSTLLLHLLDKGYECTCLSFDYGQKHKIELEKAESLVKYINDSNKPIMDGTGVFPSYPKVTHQIITLDGLSSLLNSSLVENGEDVPEGHYEDLNMTKTVVPNRNKIFSSIIQAVALSISTKNNTECVIAMGIHAGDHAIYPDCRPEFRDADFKAFRIGNYGTENVEVKTPYLYNNKYDILRDGKRCCDSLGLDFNEVYKRTLTSYKPIYIKYPESTSRVEEANRIKFGEWYSDYKSASSVERIEAFIKLGIDDPAAYADESGPVSYNVAKQHVLNLLENHNG